MIRQAVTLEGVPARSRVALVCATLDGGRAHLASLAEREHAVRVSRGHGAERAGFADGTVVHLRSTLNSSWRGDVFDVVLAPDGIPPKLLPFVLLTMLTSRAGGAA